MSKTDLENWILITYSISNGPLSASQAYFSGRKDKELSLTEYHEKIKEINIAGFISKSDAGIDCYIITKKGEQELRNRLDELKNKKPKEYLKLIAAYPLYELRERVFTLEKFVFYGAMTGFFLFSMTLEFVKTPNTLQSLLWLPLIMIFMIPATKHFLTLILFAKQGVRYAVFTKIRDLIDRYTKPIAWILGILLVGGAVTGIKYIFGYPWKDVLYRVAMGLVIPLAVYLYKNRSKIEHWKEAAKRKFSP